MTTNFGRDTSATTGLRTGRFVSGPRLVAEAIYRRLTTPRGMLRGGEEEQNYGLDLADLVGQAATTDREASLGGQISNEVKKDERVQTVDITIVRTQKGPSVAYDITLRCGTAAGPFTLQVLASDVSVDLLRITEGS